MDYNEINIIIPNDKSELKEIIVAQLADIGFESFADTDDGICAYIPVTLYKPKDTEELLNAQRLSFQTKMIAAQNWNALWESNFEPVVIDDRCLIRASFHKDLIDYPYIIHIEPKMSFGTGHHETTSGVISHMLDMDFSGQEVLDMGCGTCILAILASMKGAKNLVAVDIDPWCIENSQENCQRNSISNIQLLLGDKSVVPLKKYDTIIANINRNVLLEDISFYSSLMLPGATLILSGFYTQDFEMINAEALRNNCIFVSKKEKKNWLAVVFIKS